MRRGLALAASVAAALVAGCGGGGGDESLSPAEFRQQADAICAKYQGQLDALAQPSSLAELKDFVGKAVPIIENGVADLDTLEPPDELADKWNRAMEINRQQLEIVHDLQDAVEAGDQAKIPDLIQRGNAASAQSTRLARELGLEKCGEET